jgi:hypothetical protein
MDSKRKKKFSAYYIVIILFCLLLGLFIWFSFRTILSELDRKKDETYKKKLTSIQNKKPASLLASPGN